MSTGPQPKRLPPCLTKPTVGPARRKGCQLPAGHDGPHGVPRKKLAKNRAGGSQFVSGWEFWQKQGAERSFVERLG